MCARGSSHQIRGQGGAGFGAAPVFVIDGPPPPVAPETIARDAAGRATVRAVRLTGAWRLDGALDEAFYEEVPSVDGFIQQLPDAGEPATERTEAWVFYDAQNVYVSARVWDSAPESQWVANEMQRDSSQLVQNDYFSVVLDTFYDRGKDGQHTEVGSRLHVTTTDSRTGQTSRRDGGGHRLASWTSGYATARSEAVCRGAGCGRTRTSGSVGGQGQQRPWSTRPRIGSAPTLEWK